MIKFLNFYKKIFLIFFFFVSFVSKSQLYITEVMYNPPESGVDSLEYIEVYNDGLFTVDLNGYNLLFANSVRYVFNSSYLLQADSVVVFAVNPGAVYRNFNLNFMPLQWTGSGLSNNATTIVFREFDNDTVDLVSYTSNWVLQTNGLGCSMNFCPSNIDNNISSSWYASQDSSGTIINLRELIGSPGDIECIAPSIYNVIGGGEYCIGSTGLSVGLSNSQISASYQLKLNGTNVGSSINGTGLPIDFGVQTVSGTYTVVATLNGQNETMNGAVLITASPLAGNGITQSACGFYTWQGTTYTSSGTYTHSNSLCDVDTLYLTIIPLAGVVSNQFACGSFFWHGTTYTTSGVYTHINGVCDVDTLNLFLTPIVGFGIYETACGSYTWNGSNYTASGTYIYANNPCNIDTLYLTIIPITGMGMTQAACDSFPWNGITYTASGTYTHINSACDVDTLYLTISPTAGSSTTQVACSVYSWNGTDLTSSGTYTHANSSCDIDTLFLTITTVDTSITVFSNTLISNATNAEYQWYNCDQSQILENETNQELLPKTSGFYSVIIQQNGCTDTSSCVEIIAWGLNETKINSVSIYPNPATNSVQIKNDENLDFKHFKVLDLAGKLVIKQSFEDCNINKINVNSLNAGVYLFIISTSTQEYTTKLIIE